MGAQLRDRIEIALELFLGQDLVNLAVARATKPGPLPNDRAIELAFIALVVMPGARDEMMPRQPFLPFANRAESVRAGAFVHSPASSSFLCRRSTTKSAASAFPGADTPVFH